ncbi:MAG: IS110 family RNA-guided transposase [Planctomycetota bacterium]|jgi:transposase
MELYGGIDLHGNSSVIVLKDDKGKLVERKRVVNDLNHVLRVLEPFRPQIRGLVVESTYNWYWLVDGLMDAGFKVHLANPAAMKQYEGIKFSDDDSDAEWLADMLRLGILPVGYIYPKEQRPIRDLLRKRSGLVRQRTQNLLSIQNLMARNTGHRTTANAIKRWRDEEVDELFGNEDLVAPARAGLVVIRCLDEEIRKLEKSIRARARLRSEYDVLLSISGVGDILAMTIMLETGDIRRFPAVGNYASYCRCVDSKRLSNGKLKGSGNAKCGNKYLAWAFVEAATFAVRYNAHIQRFHQRKATKTKKKIVATKAVAHKLARACYHMLRRQERFDVARAFA